MYPLNTTNSIAEYHQIPDTFIHHLSFIKSILSSINRLLVANCTFNDVLHITVDVDWLNITPVAVEPREV